MKRMASLLAVVALAAACQTPETAEQASARMQAESDSAKAQIEQSMAAFARYAGAGQADSLASLYADNAVLMPPNMSAATGRAAIQEAFAGMLQAGAPTLHFVVQSVVANGPLAVERGTYHMTTPASAGQPASADSGKYLAHWHRIDGQWKMVDDIWNSDAPMTPAPARRRS
jgi:ketosteroid isomerase-like protein